MSKALIAFDTDHIKGYVFGTNKLKEIRGASSILDRLNRVGTKEIAESDDFRAKTIYAHGGSALFLIDSDKAEKLGKAIQKLYHEETGGGASITYAIQPIPENDLPNIMKATKLPGDVTMKQVLKLLHLRLRLAKDSLQASGLQQDASQEDIITVPSHALFRTCDSCGIGYAEEMQNDPDDSEGLYCLACIKKREEDNYVKDKLFNAPKESLSNQTLWGRILETLQDPSGTPHYELPPTLNRPKDFNVFRDFTHGKEYLGLIYADANGMGRAMEDLDTLQEVAEFAKEVDNAVFKAMGDAIRMYLPIQKDTSKKDVFPFDILLVGGDDIVMVTSADKALQVASTLAQQFRERTKNKHTLSVGVVLAPVKYPFSLQRHLVEDTIKAAKTSGAEEKENDGSRQEQSRISFVVVTGNTSSSYANIYKQMYQEKRISEHSEKFYGTMRPYSLKDLGWLMDQIKAGNEKRLGRTKLHQLREAILKLNCTTTILESLMLLHNWKEPEREFIKQMVRIYDARTKEQQQQETLFPWYRDKGNGENETIYRTPLLDFIELYDFVSS